MTHHVIKTLEDGTRVYSNGTRYKPKGRVVRPEGAVRWHGEWLLPLPLLPEEARVMPVTNPCRDVRRPRSVD